MSKIKLIKIEGYGSKSNPYIEGAEVVDLKLRVPDTEDILAIVRTDFDERPDGSTRASDALDPVVRYERINDLVGKLLTIVDVTYHDKELRQKVKDMVMQSTWDWYHGLTDDLVKEAWRKDRFPKYKDFVESI